MSGVVTVRFTEAEAAARAVAAFNGRVFAGRTVVAYVPEHKEQFSKSSKSGGDGDGLHDIDEEEIEEAKDDNGEKAT